MEVNQNYICFQEQKRNEASTSCTLLFPRKTSLAFYVLYFSVSSITISMCGGCCEMLRKLALLHPRHGQEVTHAEKTAANRGSRDLEEAASTVSHIQHQVMQTAKMLSSISKIHKEKAVKKKERNKNKLEIFCLQAALGFSSHPKKLMCCLCNLLLYTNIAISCLL